MDNTTSKQSPTSSDGLSGDNKELISNEPIKGTPFRMVGNEFNGYFIGLKNYKITDTYDTKEEALERLEAEKWEVIARIITIMYAVIKEEEDKQKE